MGCLLSVTFMTSCQDNDVDPADDSAAIGVAFTLPPNEANASNNARVTNSNVFIESGFFHISEISLGTEGRTASGQFVKEFEIKYTQPKKVTLDRFDQRVDFFLEIEEGDYEEIEMQFELATSNNEPAISLTGTYKKLNGSKVPFKFEYFDNDFEFEVEIESSTGEYFQVNKTKNPLFLFEMSPANWFSSLTVVEFETAIITNGVLLINSQINTSLFTKAKLQMKIAAEVEIKR